MAQHTRIEDAVAKVREQLEIIAEETRLMLIERSDINTTDRLAKLGLLLPDAPEQLVEKEPERKGITAREITDWFDKQKSLHGYIVVQEFLRAHNLLIEDSDKIKVRKGKPMPYPLDDDDSTEVWPKLPCREAWVSTFLREELLRIRAALGVKEE